MERPKKNAKRDDWISYADHLEVELRTSSEDLGAARASLEAQSAKVAELEALGPDGVAQVLVAGLRQELTEKNEEVRVLTEGRDQLLRQIHHLKARKG